MNFASYEFWLAFILCFAASRLVLLLVGRLWPSSEIIAGKVCLLLTGLVLLSTESWLTLGAFAWVVLLGWLAVLLQESWRPGWCRTAVWMVLLVAQLVPLLYFKYWNFLFNEVLGLEVRIPSVLIPMGLSFYTFQTIGFWVDNLRKPQNRPAFIDYLNFASFFPQIVAGPIEKRESLQPQIEKIRFRIQRGQVNGALQWIVLGLAYKLVVADNVASISDKFQIDTLNAWHVWFECLAFGVRIYFDFAGYSFIAIGLGLLFGIKLTLNFRSPYWASNLRDFWRDWHVTLGAWLRDYVYLPLGGRRVKWWAVNILLVFFVSGIWHGAGFGFLVWGLLHGVGVIVSGISVFKSLPAFVGRIVTFGYVTFAWLFFFERDLSVMGEKARALAGAGSYSFNNLINLQAILSDRALLLSLICVFALATAALILEGLDLRRGKACYASARHPVVSLMLVVLIVLLAPTEESSFIYFNF